MQEVAPGAVLTSTDTLTPAFLQGIDTLIVGASADTDVAVSPLSGDEQTAMLNFVLAGGNVAIVVENEAVGPGPSGSGDTSFESFLDPFGVDVTGRSNAVLATVTQPGHVAINGPYGGFSQFTTSFSGWFDNLGPFAQALATDDDSGLPVLAVIDDDVIAPGSGRVWLLADGRQSVDPSVLNATLLLKNGLAYVLDVPEPGTMISGGLGLGAFAIMAWRRRRRDLVTTTP